MGMFKHSQSSQNIKFVMSLQYLHIKVREEVVFFSHADKHQSFLQVYFNNLGIKADSIIIDEHGQALSK